MLQVSFKNKNDLEISTFVPTISIFYGIFIQMFWGDQSPGHFHAVYGEDEVIIDIRTLEIIKGTLPTRALELVLEWAFLHREALREDWTLCAMKQVPLKITPLE